MKRLLTEKRIFSRFAAAGLAVSLSLGGFMTAFAMPPYDNIPEGVSEEEWNRLSDNVIEYDEIENLVKYYNPAYTQATDSADGSYETMSLAVDQFDTYYSGLDLSASIKTAQSAVNSINNALSNPSLSAAEREKYQKQLAELNVQLATAEGTQKTLSKTVRSLSDTMRRTKKSTEIQMRPVLRQLEYGMQSVFLQYHQLLINKEIVEKQVELYRTILDTSANSEGQGLSTEADRLSAENDLKAAEVNLESINNGIETIRRSMGLQLGWSADKLPDIGVLPEPDIGFVDTTNPDADKTAAIMHNSELKDEERYSGGQDKRDITDRRANEYRGKLIAKMDSLYADMKNKKALYAAAETGMEKAELEKASADRKYQMGLLGNADYEALQMSYISSLASYELAKLNLFSAINTYKWAVDGVVTLE